MKAASSFVLVGLVALAAPALARQGDWKDASPHVAMRVTVEEGVQLEVLDWGGFGPALVLLAGLGGTAHHYDDLAPRLATRYRVVGVTRRGHRGSSAPLGGYDFGRLADDVLRVMDAVGVNTPVVIGHSFAGEELHVLGARDAERIRGLVYIDAAFNRGDDADSTSFNAVARAVPAAPSPTPTDLASFEALRAYLNRHGGAGPEAHLRTRYRTNPDGSVADLWVPDPPIRKAMSSEIQAAYRSYSPPLVRVPALAIYAMPASSDDLLRRGSSDRLPFPDLVRRAAEDPTLREGVEELYRLTGDRVRNHEQWFKTLAERGQVTELPGTHELVISNPDGVLEEISNFLSSLP
jgi:pimeloyl-ACP methyl ester carboxylesterase